nr:hypothetical protein [uncultured Blautia sp.]
MTTVDSTFTIKVEVMDMKWKVGDTCYFVENNFKIIEATITSIHGNFAVVKYGPNKGIRLRTSRLYPTPDEAHDARIYHYQSNSNPYFYDH